MKDISKIFSPYRKNARRNRHGRGGFRFLYAAFLEEAQKYDLDKAILQEASKLIIHAGNTLREFALYCVEGSKKIEKLDTCKIANKLIEASEYEEKAFRLLKNFYIKGAVWES